MRRLDFLVLGVPRTGTTALSKALSLHPDVLCAVERIDVLADPRRISFPQSFRKAPAAPDRRYERTMALMARKGGLVPFVGDKNPRYYCNLRAWTALPGGIRTIATYRSPYQYLDSWHRRALKGVAWPAEQQGLFGLWELFALLRSCLDHAGDTLIVPYEACFFDNPATIDRVLAHIGADPARFDRRRFLATMFAKERHAGPRPELPAEDKALLDLARVETIDRIMLAPDTFLIGARRAEIERYLGSIPPALAEAGEAWLTARQGSGMTRFRNAWAALFPDLDRLPNPAAVPPTLRRDAAVARTLQARVARRARAALAPAIAAARRLRDRISGA